MLEKELEIAIKAATLASKRIMEIYLGGFHVETKSDDSPVTEADKASERIILSLLKEHFPQDAILSEESDDDLSRLSNPRVWIIDPLDGTKDFVKKDGEFAVNIALSVNNEIALGLIAAPNEDKIYYAVKGEGAFLLDKGSLQKITVSNRGKGEGFLLSSESKTNQNEVNAFYSKNKEWFASSPKALGSSLKMARIAEGKADFFFRTNAVTKEWDVAPASIILKEAGGLFLEGKTKREFVYNKEDVINHHGYIASNKELAPLAKLVEVKND